MSEKMKIPTTFLFLCVIFTPVRGKVQEGVLSTQDSLLTWEFLARFCFVSQQGRLKYEIEFPASFAPQFLYLYYDSQSQWPAVYKTNPRKTCQEKSQVLKPENNQIVKLGPASPYDLNMYYTESCLKTQRNGQLWYKCSDERRFLSYRERWWYLAVANCNSTQGLFLEYKLTMTNGDPDDIWFHQFSADEFLILPTDIAFLLLELFTLIIAITVALLLRARQMFHQTFKLFLVSLVLEIVSLSCDCIAYGNYATNGVGLPMLKRTGEMARAASKLTFLLLLILMGKGYTITRGRISLIGTWKIALFMTTYSLVYGTLFIWEARVFDPGQVLYLYDSPLGYGIMVMRIIGWLWFCYAVYFTLVNYPEKRGFYFRFSVVFSVWFWLGPVVILLSNHLLSNWHREKVVNGIENVIAWIGFAAFLFITRPSAANRNFPYHVRTTQIDVMNDSEDSENSISLPHHTYALESFPKHDVFTVGDRSRGMTSVKQIDPFIRQSVRPGSPTPADPLNQSADSNPTDGPPPSYEEIVSYKLRNQGVTLGAETAAI